MILPIKTGSGTAPVPYARVPATFAFAATPDHEEAMSGINYGAGGAVGASAGAAVGDVI